MRCRKDAHQRSDKVRSKQGLQFKKGIVMLALSLGLMFYAVPCFAASVWDDKTPSSTSNTAFSSTVSDNEYAAVAAETQSSSTSSLTDEEVLAKYGIGASETVGPGLLSNDNAVKSAKLRAQAVSVAKAERDSRVLATKYSDAVATPEPEPDLTLAYAALAMSLITGVFGAYTVLKARSMKGRVISAAYDSALRAV